MGGVNRKPYIVTINMENIQKKIALADNNVSNNSYNEPVNNRESENKIEDCGRKDNMFDDAHNFGIPDTGENHCSLPDAIREKFQGANISVSTVNGLTVTGEVVFDLNYLIALKANNIITFINPEYIVSFV